MTIRSVSEVLAGAAARMVSADHDVTGALATLLSGAVETVPADAAGILVKDETGRVELLAATSHQVADLEMYQAQVEQGPCIDALETDDAVDVEGAAVLLRRWPVTGPAIVDSGYASVHAAPLRWRGVCYGALNVFRCDEVPVPDAGAACRALADAATLLLVTSGHVDRDHLSRSLAQALEARSAVEQAKGALAHVRGLDMAQAFDALADIAAAEGLSLGQASRVVMDRARRRTLR